MTDPQLRRMPETIAEAFAKSERALHHLWLTLLTHVPGLQLRDDLKAEIAAGEADDD